MNNSHSNICEILLLLERDRQNCQAVLAASGMHGLTYPCIRVPLEIFIKICDTVNLEKIALV